ncbi:aldose 1-epimerase [Sphingomonas jejuensis]|uniref:Aldose 1-epimerase n=1 Tax=Sphingomonas jejuensis TaxID=904715 RepID=A0ABX0XHA9_9SPHN|nr:aldose epimerase family protein [Sphingomonas jejuensis]NJC32712.1 aldose 1-epimerase [Sphingomonas jejuensis]
MPIITYHDLPDGRRAARVELRSPGGVRVSVTNLGATLMGIDAPDRTGRIAPVLLGHRDPADYPTGGGAGANHYYGATCGRVANRIRDAAFDMDGMRYGLDANEGRHHLHGGRHGFSHALWHIESVEDDAVSMQLDSLDGDQGYPGRLVVAARFSLSAEGRLLIGFSARTDRPTHVNIVSHGYFNLSGDIMRSIADHELTIFADSYLPIDGDALPTGARVDVSGTPFDFRNGRIVGNVIDTQDDQLRLGDGFNHCFVPDGGGMRPVARLHHPGSGRTLDVATDQPGLQLYTGNALSPRRSALCLEAQGWPDSANHPGFPSTRLDPGETYRSTTLLTFTAA